MLRCRFSQIEYHKHFIVKAPLAVGMTLVVLKGSAHRHFEGGSGNSWETIGYLAQPTAINGRHEHGGGAINMGVD